MSGCLVTDEITFDYEEKNVPPVILDVQGSKTPIGEIIYFDVESPSTIEFEFLVRDENIDQPLEGRSKISYQQYLGSTVVFIPTIDTRVIPIPADYQPIRNSGFNYSEDSFERDNCYRIDLAVSFEFENESDQLRYWDIPAAEGDIARARWYVVTGEETQCGWATKYEK